MRVILSFVLFFFSLDVISIPKDSSCVNQEEKLYLNSFLKKSADFDFNKNLSCDMDENTLSFKKGRYLFNIGEYREALELFQELLVSQIDKEKSSVAYYIGKIYYQTGDYNQAINYYKISMDNENHKNDAMFQVGRCYHKLESYELSNETYFSMIQLQPNSHASWNNIGVNFEQMGDYTRSLQFYRIADSIVDGKEPLYQSNIIQALKQCNQLNNAREYANQAYNNYPDYVRITVKYASIHNKLGQNKKAIEIVRPLLNKKPKDPDLNFQVGYSYGQLGMPDSALKYYYEDIKYGYNRYGTLQNISSIYRVLGKFDLSLKCIQRSLAIKPNHRNSLHGLINLYTWMKEPNNALAALKNYLEVLGYNEEKNANLVGYTLLEAKRYEEALPYFIASIYLKPDISKAYNNLGRCYAKLGKYKKADSLFSIAITIDSTNSYIYHNRASMHYDIGNKSFACEDLKKAIHFEYNWIIDSTLMELSKSYCDGVNIDRKILFHGYSGDLLEYSNNYSFIELMTNSKMELSIFDTSDVFIEKKKEVSLENNSLKETNKYNLYPNPTTGNFKIEFKEKVMSFRIFDSSGNIIRFKKASKENIVKFDISDQPNGQYFVIASDDSDVKFTDVIILSR